MSQAETLSSDYRSFAHYALETLHGLTGRDDTKDPLYALLINEGLVTVLIALLSNEEGTVKNLACGILANLLCWEV